MEIALAQLELRPADVAANRERALGAIQEAVSCGADLVVLPELFTVGYFAFDSYARHAEGIGGETLTAIREVADTAGIAVLAGSIVEDLAASAENGFETPAKEGYANTAVFIDDAGEVRTVYRKQHLFGYGSVEDELLTPGESLPTTEFGGFTIGTTTCYDLRFPELYRALVDSGVTLMLVPSAWPYPRVEHWQVLPKARAVENLSYVVAVNGVGEFEDAALCGRSAVYDPWGTPQATLGEESGVALTRITPEAVERRREDFPVLQDRRGGY